MSGSQATITVAAPPTTEDVAADGAAWMGGQSGTLTDFNSGSQIRTELEATGSVVEMQAVTAQALAFQAMVYSAWAAFNVIPYVAVSSVGQVTFVTGTGASPPVAPSPILIPVGTVVQTVGGIQFVTVAVATIPTGSTSTSVVVNAVTPGSSGNVAAGAISQIQSSLSWPLQVSNTAPIVGGADAETPAETMARFTAVVAALGLCTPVAIANGCIGVSVSGTSEVVEYATVYEPWVTQVANGAVSGLTVGYDVYVDNGSGSASTNLLTAVTIAMNGNAGLGEDGFRPAGVPYNVYAVEPVYCTVVVSGAAIDSSLDATLNALSITAVNQYFATLGFGATAEYPQIVAAVSNQTAGNLTSLSVQLLNVSGVSVNGITPPGMQRVILQTLSVNFS